MRVVWVASCVCGPARSLNTVNKWISLWMHVLAHWHVVYTAGIASMPQSSGTIVSSMDTRTDISSSETSSSSTSMASRGVDGGRVCVGHYEVSSVCNALHIYWAWLSCHTLHRSEVSWKVLSLTFDWSVWIFSWLRWDKHLKSYVLFHYHLHNKVQTLLTLEQDVLARLLPQEVPECLVEVLASCQHSCEAGIGGLPLPHTLQHWLNAPCQWYTTRWSHTHTHAAQHLHNTFHACFAK